jgi:hypothetical protein
MTSALIQTLCGCTQPWQIHQQIVTYYTAVPERRLFVVTWWVRAHGLCRTQVVRLGQGTCLPGTSLSSSSASSAWHGAHRRRVLRRLDRGVVGTRRALSPDSVRRYLHHLGWCR